MTSIIEHHQKTSYDIKTYNNIAHESFSVLESGAFTVNACSVYEAILCRSKVLSIEDIPHSVLGVARAGSGTNNLPVKELSQRGCPVFNAPGANANAVKELVLGALFMAKRNLKKACQFVDHLSANIESLEEQVESGKKQFSGNELASSCLGIIGLGAIGVSVANAAIGLGMKVIGFDPYITTQHSWQLSSQVQHAETLKSLCEQADVLSVHVPLMPETSHMINKKVIGMLPKGAMLLNFSRADLVDKDAVFMALNNGQLSHYICDFPEEKWLKCKNVLCFPHLGASTKEAEINCAKMALSQLKTYLSNGSIKNAVNFPDITVGPVENVRIALVHDNIPSMVSQITHIISSNQFNIDQLYNCSREQLAYSIIDMKHSSRVSTLLGPLSKVNGVRLLRFWD